MGQPSMCDRLRYVYMQLVFDKRRRFIIISNPNTRTNKSDLEIGMNLWILRKRPKLQLGTHQPIQTVTF